MALTGAGMWVTNDSGLLVYLSQEYVDYNGGAGVQHIALKTQDIIAAVRNPLLVLSPLSFIQLQEQSLQNGRGGQRQSWPPFSGLEG